MPRYLHRRGLESNRTNITPPSGEIIITTDEKRLFIGDGSTAGGLEIAYIKVTDKGVVGGVAELDSNGKVPTSQLPAIALTDVFVVGSESEQTSLTAQEGDVAVRTDENKSYVHNGGTAGDMSDWQELLTPTDAVQSVNGQTGSVVLDTDDIAEGSTNLYYTDARVDARIAAASIDDLSDVDTSTNPPANDQVLTWDDTNSQWAPKALPSGVTEFTALNDTPSSYSGEAGKLLAVNSSEDAVEFTDTIDGGSF